MAYIMFRQCYFDCDRHLYLEFLISADLNCMLISSVCRHMSVDYAFLQCAATVLHAVLSVAFSVSPSLTLQYCVKTNERWMMPSLLAISTMYLVLGNIRFINIFARDQP